MVTRGMAHREIRRMFNPDGTQLVGALVGARLEEGTPSDATVDRSCSLADVTGGFRGLW